MTVKQLRNVLRVAAAARQHRGDHALAKALRQLSDTLADADALTVTQAVAKLKKR